MFKNFAERRTVIFDGAMGTSIQKANVPDEIWRGKNGCNEFLNLAAPETILNIHKKYFDAGANVAVTNTFGAIGSVLSEYGLEDKTSEINREAVSIARRAAEGRENAFVALSMGPGTKLPSLGHTSYSELYFQYREQASAGLGADLFLIETCQDLIQIRAAVNACSDVLAENGSNLPIIVSFTVEENGAMLTGSDVTAAAAVARGLPIYALGMNCSLGPDAMEATFLKLAAAWGGKLYLSPNAGLPETVNGKTVYGMNGGEFSKAVKKIAGLAAPDMIGGCCGTDSEHIESLKAFFGNSEVPSPRNYEYTGEAASLYSASALSQIPAPSIIGERANATGSKAFRQLLLSEDIDGITSLCKIQEEEGAHFIDLSLAYAGKNEKNDYEKITPVLNGALYAPLVMDSTDPDALLTAVERYSGKPILNSINFEDGGEKLRRTLGIARKHPSCVVALTIDESGMAQTAGKKLEIATRLRDVWIASGFPAEDLILDVLTFSIGSGDVTLRYAAAETLDAVEAVKKELPGVKTVLGISNVSFGLNPVSRTVLNAVFLNEAVKRGLDMAIIHPSKLVSAASLSEDETKLCKDLIYSEDGALTRFIEYFSDKTADLGETKKEPSVEDALPLKIIKGDKAGLDTVIRQLLDTKTPEEILNGLLFPAMQKVGDMFGEGKMLLPFVLQSAETMKAAVKILEPRFQKLNEVRKASVVLATVQGDVHDIGKNLVDIIMSNNGFKVHNLGTKVSVSEMISKAIETGAQAIGMSGLLVKSTTVMKENIEEISKRLPDIKIMLGGAALTGKFVKENCAPIMPGKVFYCRDAFDNIAVMEDARKPESPAERVSPEQTEGTDPEENYRIKHVEIPASPFYGTRIIEDIRLKDVFEYVNKASLFSGSWGYKKKGIHDSEYDDMIKKTVVPEYNALKNRILSDAGIAPKVIYGFFKARARGNAVEIFQGNDVYPVWVLHFPKRRTEPFITLADYFSRDPDAFDVMPMQIVTLGTEPVEYCKKLFKNDNYKDYFMTHGLFTELTDALAELVHKLVRKELKIDGNDSGSIDGLLSGKYRGRRYSFGYPMTPDTENNAVLASVLGAERIGVEVNDTYQMVPEYTTCAIIVHHPEARY